MDWHEARALAAAFVAATIAVGIAITMSIGAIWAVSKIDPAPAPTAKLYIPEGCK